MGTNERKEKIPLHFHNKTIPIRCCALDVNGIAVGRQGECILCAKMHILCDRHTPSALQLNSTTLQLAVVDAGTHTRNAMDLVIETNEMRSNVVVLHNNDVPLELNLCPIKLIITFSLIETF